MKRLIAGIALSALVAAPAYATLPVGAKAPVFTTTATIGGKEFQFSLADALKKGPVVLYFYPAAFTPGCTIEAHNFAAAMDQYKSYGATVIGVSHDPIKKLDQFSVQECQSAFTLGADTDGKIIKAYDTVSSRSADRAARTSYVIAPSGEILYVYSNGSPDHHVANTMAVVRKWATEHK